VPDLVRAAISGQSLMIRNPLAVRPWQHVLEPLSGYLSLGQQLWSDASLAGAWNFGPHMAGEVTVQSLVERLRCHWPALQIEYDQARHPHEAAILRLNWDKAREQLSWRPVWNMDTTLAKTAMWYRRFHEDGSLTSGDDLVAYVSDAQRLGLEWARCN